MNEKSYVGMERKVCAVCGQEFDTNTLLLDRRLRNTLERHTVTGWGLCPEHQKLFDDGFVALVEFDPEKTTEETLSGAYRTGKVAHLRRTVAQEIFNVPIGDSPLCFVEPGVIETLAGISEESES